jgi:Fe-S cluster biosynthesis and repair protein YggX/cytochrome c-type biogenesis protein CcmH/NrfG
MEDASRLARLRKMAQENPHDELVNFSLGNALLHSGDVKEAAECLQRVLALNPRNSKAYQLLGEAQVRTDQPQFAVQTLTNGYRVAQRQGDMMPMKAMADILKELGAEIPAAPEKASGSAAASAAAGGFVCRRCGGPGPRLKQQPFKGPLGEQVFAGVCQACWTEWVGIGTKVINELHLPMYDPIAQETYDRHMREFLMLD